MESGHENAGAACVFIVTFISSSTNNENIIAETDEIYQLPSDILNVGQNVLLVVQVCASALLGNNSKHPSGQHGNGRDWPAL